MYRVILNDTVMSLEDVVIATLVTVIFCRYIINDASQITQNSNMLGKSIDLAVNYFHSFSLTRK